MKLLLDGMYFFNSPPEVDTQTSPLANAQMEVASKYLSTLNCCSCRLATSYLNRLKLEMNHRCPPASIFIWVTWDLKGAGSSRKLSYMALYLYRPLSVPAQRTCWLSI